MKLTSLTVILPLLCFAGCALAPSEVAQKIDAGSFVGNYVLAADADAKPKLTVAVPPAFPASAAKLNLKGSVDVAFIIDTSGKPTQIRAVKATNEGFAASAVAAVAKWQFSPAVKDGKPVACLVRQKLSFTPDSNHSVLRQPENVWGSG